MDGYHSERNRERERGSMHNVHYVLERETWCSMCVCVCVWVRKVSSVYGVEMLKKRDRESGPPTQCCFELDAE